MGESLSAASMQSLLETGGAALIIGVIAYYLIKALVFNFNNIKEIETSALATIEEQAKSNAEERIETQRAFLTTLKEEREANELARANALKMMHEEHMQYLKATQRFSQDGVYYELNDD